LYPVDFPLISTFRMSELEEAAKESYAFGFLETEFVLPRGLMFKVLEKNENIRMPYYDSKIPKITDMTLFTLDIVFPINQSVKYYQDFSIAEYQQYQKREITNVQFKINPDDILPKLYANMVMTRNINMKTSDKIDYASIYETNLQKILQLVG